MVKQFPESRHPIQRVYNSPFRQARLPTRLTNSLYRRAHEYILAESRAAQKVLRKYSSQIPTFLSPSECKKLNPKEEFVGQLRAAVQDLVPLTLARSPSAASWDGMQYTKGFTA